MNPSKKQDEAAHLIKLAAKHWDRYKSDGDLDNLERAIQLDQQAVDYTLQEHPDWANRLINLGLEYWDMYQDTDDLDSLDESIRLAQKVVDATPIGHQERASRLQSLGAGKMDRYKAEDDIEDLHSSIQLQEEALDLTPESHPDLVHQLYILGTGYLTRYSRLGIAADIDQSIRLIQKTLDVSTDSDPNQGTWLQVLGRAYWARHERLGDPNDLEMSIQLSTDALEDTPEGSLTLAYRLFDLGVGYGERYQRTGAICDLEQSIQFYERAADLTPKNAPELPERLAGVGTALRDKYERFGAMEDLERCIKRHQDALNLTPEGHPERPGRLYSLGIAYGDKHQRTGLKDLEASIRLKEETVALTPENHPSRAERLNGLAVGYDHRFQRTGNMTDLDCSLRLNKEALDATPRDLPDRADRLHSLGAGYLERHRVTTDNEDLDKALQLLQEAVDSTSKRDPQRTHRLGNLGAAYMGRHGATGAEVDLVQANKAYEEALSDSSSPIRDRLKSGIHLLSLYAKQSDWHKAYEAASTTVSLVPLLVTRSLENSDKQHLLREAVGLASDAAAVALNVGRSPLEAVQLLELGRGVISRSLNELRSDLTPLDQVHPQLAVEFQDLRDHLDNATPRKKRRIGGRDDVAKSLDAVILKIRKVPGFGRFLLPPLEDELRLAAEIGPIVVITASEYRCDGLVIEKSGIRAVSLPMLKLGEIRDHSKEGLAGRDVLEWLWRTLAKPILQTLELELVRTHSGGDWPRVWWIPTGVLTRFPIHAAGHLFDHSSDTVLDRVISSYSTSVSAIIYSRSHCCQPTPVPTPKRMVLMAMNSTPEHTDLKYASEEVNRLEKLCRSANLQTVRPTPLQEDVLSALTGCELFHFAGHGKAHHSDPSRSCLLLEDWQRKPLTVESILNINLQQRSPLLAYLSACGTGRIQHEEFLEEGLHLIGAFQLAGFQNVIGTLWKVNDELCVDMALMTYDWIQSHNFSHESVSEGLHHATRILRDRWVIDNGDRGVSKSLEGKDSTLETQRSGLTLCSNQKRGKEQRDAELCDEPRVSELLWVPYVHFGV